jgi:prevent-host-death family protein
MKTIELAKATASLAKYAQNAKKGPVILTEKGKPVAALVSIENADLETVRLSNHPRFLALIERSRRRQNVEGGISGDEMRNRLGLKRGLKRTLRRV